MRQTLTRPPSLFAFVLICVSPAAGRAAPVDFAHDVLPLLKARCVKCHSGGVAKGDLLMDTRESLLASGVVVSGASGESELMARVTSSDPDLRMPQGDSLDAAEIAVLAAWIDQGLAWQEGFSFAAAKYVAPLAPRTPTLPAVVEGRTHPIDRIVDAYFREQDLPRPTRADDATFLRRVYLDLVGLLPDEETLRLFLDEPDDGKRERVVRILLEDAVGYADHWITFWNDLLRNDYEGTGYIDGGRKQITRWLYDSLLENKPYDQFVRELINPTAASEGFIKGIQWRGRVNASQVYQLQFAQNVSQVMLGINLKCASCHDSFIDDWKLADAYGLAAIVSDEPLEIHRCDKPTGQTAQAAFLFPELGTIPSGEPKAARLETLAALITCDDNGRFARTIVNRLWHRLMGRGVVHPVDVMGNPPWSADLLDYLASHLVDHDYDLKQTLALITTSQIYQAAAGDASPADVAAEDYRFTGPLARRMTAEQFQDAVWAITEGGPEKVVADVGFRGRRGGRAALMPADSLLRALGRPNREQVVTTRPDELTTLQALDLTNGEALAEQLDGAWSRLALRYQSLPGEEIVAEVYRRALSRPPTTGEMQVAQSLLGERPAAESFADLLWSVIMLPEFQAVR